jgi:hypothetical protein
MVRPCLLVPLIAIVLAGCGGSNPSGPSQGGSTAVTSIQILGAVQFDLIGDTRQLSVLAFRANGTTSTATTGVAWISSNTAAITISPAGLATALDVGPAVISAIYEGVGATLPMRVGAPNDCSSYFPAELTVLSGGGNFTVAAPLGPTTYSLLAAFATEADAAAGLAVFQRYRNYCFVGRNTTRTPRLDYVVGYWLNQFGLATTINNEDCEPYDRATVAVVDRGATGWAVMASGRQLQLLDTAADATTMASMIRTYSNQCYIGRGNSRESPDLYIHPYWK